jgi:glycosyltransferase involved in cell wall biosynthesis
MKQITNILFISHYNHYRMGGQKSMLALIENLDRRKFRPYVICPEPGELSDRLKELDCQTFFIPLKSLKVKNLSAFLSNFFKLKSIINKNHIDIIHPDHERDCFLSGLAKKATKTKLVWHVRLARKNNLDKINEKFADGIIGISEGTAVRFSDEARKKGKFRVIFNGVDCSLFQPVQDLSSLRRQLLIPESKLVVIFVGQLVKGKGIFDLTKAFAILREKISPDKMPYLYFIGTPASNEVMTSLSNMIRDYDLGSFVNIIPQQNKIYRWMQASDVLVLPSHEGTEGMGRVLFEAMACGAATIGTDTSGVREAISEDSGFLVNEKAPLDIAEKIELLINDPELLSKKKIYGRKRALLLFDIKKHASNVEKFYYDILKNRL